MLMYRVILLAKDRRRIRELSTITGTTKVEGWRVNYSTADTFTYPSSLHGQNNLPPRLGYIFYTATFYRTVELLGMFVERDRCSVKPYPI